MDPLPLPAVSRRSFLHTVAAGAVAGMAHPVVAQFAEVPASELRLRLALGMDNFAVRAMGWKAPALIDYAASLKLDTLLISDLDAYEKLDEAYLAGIKAKADEAGLRLYQGSWSICPTSPKFKNNWGTAEEHLQLGLRVAKAVGSPVLRVVLGSMEDRRTEGGIRARIADTVKVLKACEKQARDARIMIAVENHAGDLHSWELADLIHAAGPEFVGANIDSGNAAWTLEDPLQVLENLGRFTVCSSLRDNMIWETPDGAAIQWTAVGEGLIDWKSYVERWKVLCPAVPIQIETISGFTRQFPYKKDDFWKFYHKNPIALERFEALAKGGREIPPFKAPDGPGKLKAEQDYQKGELERSIKYLREVIGVGLRA